MHRQDLPRFALRHVIGEAARRHLARALGYRLVPDAHGDATGAYGVRSLYFESLLPAGQRRRLRVRGYEREGGQISCWLELRHRIGRRSTKARERVPEAVAMAAARGEHVGQGPAPSGSVLEEACQLARLASLRPVMALRHRRQAFSGTSSEPDLRVTIDSDMKGRVDDLGAGLRWPDEGFRVLPEGLHLVEVRVAGAVPAWLKLLLERVGCRALVPGKLAMAQAAAVDALAHTGTGG